MMLMEILDLYKSIYGTCKDSIKIIKLVNFLGSFISTVVYWLIIQYL